MPFDLNGDFEKKIRFSVNMTSFTVYFNVTIPRRLFIVGVDMSDQMVSFA